MLKIQDAEVVFSPSDLIRYLSSPFVSWMDRYYLESPVQMTLGEDSADQRRIKEARERPFSEKEGTMRPLGLEDFLFIAPYNAQAYALKDALQEGAKVGSVDRFQGQEAPVCILSLCSSAGEYGSHGLGSILDKNRVNVAKSRAKALAVIVADPRIADTLPGRIDEIRLLNLFCKVLAA